MKALFCLLIAVTSYLLLPQADEKGPAVQVGGKAYVRVEAHNVGDTVKIHSIYLSLLTFQQLFTKDIEILSDSSCLLTFETDIPTKYDLSVDKEVTIPIFLVPGDTLTIKVDYRQHNNTADITYEGHYAQINQYLYEKPKDIAFDREGARLFNSPFHMKTPEKSLLQYKHRSDSMLAAQLAYLHTKADSINLPSWFVESEEIESSLFVRYHQLIIADYWNIFFQADLKIPDDYFNSVKPIDITNPNALNSLYYYLYLPIMITKMPEFVQYKNRFLDSCGVKSVDDLKGTKAYTTYYLKHAKYVSDKADELLPDQSLHPFLTNHFFHMIKVLDRAERQELLDNIKLKLRDTPFLPFTLKHYEELSLHLSTGEVAPGFYLLSANDNKYLSLGDFKGKVLLLNFWFPGCKPCIYEIPHEKQLMKKYGDKGFVVVNICMQATVKHWQMAIEKFDLEGINVVTQGNWERKLKEAYGVDAFPHYVLVDQEGKVVENRTHRPSDPRLGDLIVATINK